MRILIVPLVTLVITWFVYVPIHELLHVLGCVSTGGEVTRLELSARYGAEILSKWFPFVVSGSDYAGQLKGFDTKGSDFCYLATVFLPFALTILLGVPLVKIAGRKRRPVIFGFAIVLGLTPFFNLQGDYFEMGSIVATRGATILSGGGPLLYEKVRSDDVFKLLSDFFERPETLGLVLISERIVAGFLIVVSGFLAILFAFGTYWLGHLFSSRVVRTC